MKVASLRPLDFPHRDLGGPQVTGDRSPVAAGSLYPGTPQGAEALSPSHQPLVALRRRGHTQLAQASLPRWSRATATWTSRWVSTPRITSVAAFSGSVIITSVELLSLWRSRFPPDAENGRMCCDGSRHRCKLL